MNPFCIDRDCNAIIISNRADRKIFSLFESMGIMTIETIDNPSLPKPVADHPDMSIHPVRKDLFVIDPMVYDYYYEKLSPYRIEIIKASKNLGERYPHDCRLNISRIKNYYIHNSYSDPLLSNLFELESFKKIEVKQGYCKCSTLIINCDTIVTSDKGIYKSLLKNNINSFLIPPGFIKLEGYEYGFIGGVGGLIGSKRLFLSGDPNEFLYGNDLINILNKYSIEPIYVKGLPFVDIGSIICIL
ncbi:MAG: hypothetical protein Q4P34_08835 [Tissierellia bacterium]|nr:hypothetical protein [Tissierellia bacterium]